MSWTPPPRPEWVQNLIALDKPRGSRGRHAYSLEAFGLDPEIERERFAFYRKRFGVPEDA